MKLLAINKSLSGFFACVLMLGGISQANACINSYVFDLGKKPDRTYIRQQLKVSHAKQHKSLEELNDYGVLLIYDGQYKKAIDLFQTLEKSHPGLAKTAANLGTAYELDDQAEQAKYWIIQGMQRDPNIHQGSEWIHVLILDAQVQQRKNPKWIQSHDVLSLDFGEKPKPIAKIKAAHFNEQTFDLTTVLEHGKIQMAQRLMFVEHDPITAQIVFNMANIEVILYNTEEDAAQNLFMKSRDLGYLNPALIEARNQYINSSKWYAFKSFFAGIARQIRVIIQYLMA